MKRAKRQTATRESILEAAREIALQDGWGAVTVRRVADKIAYAPPVIYEHFAGKDAMLGELQSLGFTMLADSVTAACADVSPEESILRVTDVYWRFAFDHPELYQIMHGWESKALSSEQTLEGARRAAAATTVALNAWSDATGATLHDPQGAIETLWALLHGMVSVTMLERIGGEAPKAKLLADRAVRDLLRSWAAHGQGE